MADDEENPRRYRWWCAYCQRHSDAIFETRGAAYEAGLAHISQVNHGLTTIKTPAVDEES